MADLKWLDEIERRNAQRTQGKWAAVECDPYAKGPYAIVASPGKENQSVDLATITSNEWREVDSDQTEKNADFIASAPDDIEQLTKALRVAVEALEKHRGFTYPAEQDRRRALEEIERIGRSI